MKAPVRGELDDFFVWGNCVLFGIHIVIPGTFFVLYEETTEFVSLNLFTTAQGFHDYFQYRFDDGDQLPFRITDVFLLQFSAKFVY